MCGIIGYIGHRQAYPLLIKGLHRLEYRGYDSTGIALLNGDIKIYKKAGKVSSLEEVCATQDTAGTVGIGHTRWATHGAPNDRNAHPHFSPSKGLAIIHNGIIENYAALKEELLHRGHRFESETDTEVLIHLIEDIQRNEGLELAEAIRVALHEVVGAYAIVVLSRHDSDSLIAARKGSPLVIGVGNNEFFVASDATPIVEHTRNVVYLNDEEIAVMRRDGNLQVRTIGNVVRTPYIEELELKLEMIEKGGFDHFMLKEIYEQPHSIRDSLRGRLNAETGTIKLGGFAEYEQRLIQADKLTIVACGTSWHAGVVGEYLFEDLARIPVEVEYASEFRYRNPIISSGDLMIAISQSGETADTLAAVHLGKQHGATVFGICNVVGSSIARATDAGSFTHAGPEIGVASTKAFTAQVAVLSMLAFLIGYKKGTLTQSRYFQLITELDAIPDKVREVLKSNEQIRYIADFFKDARNFLYLGRGYNFPVALEGALKLKEISYIHAEGYPAAEMKHGPIALIDEEMPVVVLATKGGAYDKIINNIEEVKARKGRIIAVVTQGDQRIRDLAEFVIEIPETEEPLTPLLSVVPLQLLAYHIAVLRGCNVDQPRNLAKSVTVE
ncbi:MAG: glutamine--fructose-6-phosphate transaminase (isomerizing) [Chitinophagales bacterium]|nr:glutamine--fructose-6-phosphate transaminase (isomerizing) [Chitinophagales bacterium]